MPAALHWAAYPCPPRRSEHVPIAEAWRESWRGAPPGGSTLAAVRAARLLLLAAATLPLSAVQARADLMPTGYTSAKLSIRVDGQLPAGKALVLSKTFQGADVLAMAEVQRFEWHPLLGDLRLVLIDASDVPKIEPARKVRARDAIERITARGVPCSETFEGVRILPRAEPAREVRWIWTVEIAGGSCTGVLVRTEHLDEDGAVVDPKPAASAPSPAPPEASAATRPAETRPAAPAARKGCGACDVGFPDGGMGPALLVLTALAAAARARSRLTRAAGNGGSVSVDGRAAAGGGRQSCRDRTG
jgi:hypothetical protein